MSNPNTLGRWFLLETLNRLPTEDIIRKQYLGTRILPFREVPTWKFTWDELRSRNNLGGVYAADGQAVPGHDLRFSTRFAEVANLMAMRTLRQDDVMTLREAGEIGVRSNAERAAAQVAMDKLAERLQWCRNALESTIEYLCMWSLQGSLTWPPKTATGGTIANPPSYWGKVSFTLTASDLGFNPNFIQSATTLTGVGGEAGGHLSWKDPNATPVQDLELIARYMRSVLGISVRGATIIMDDDVLSYLTANTTLLSWIRGTERGTNYVAPSELVNYFKSVFGYDIVTYSASWTYETGIDTESPTINQIPFLKAGRIIIIPPGEAPGFTADAVHLHSDGSYSAGLDVWEYQNPKPPYDLEVGCKRMCFPVVQRASEIFVLDAWD